MGSENRQSWISRAARRPLRRLAATTLRGLGVAHLNDARVALRALTHGRVARVPVLAYHEIAPVPPSATPEQVPYFVAPDVFREQMTMLAAAGYESVLASELCEALAGSVALPERPVVLTFDDGYASVAEHVASALASLGFRATLFLIAGCYGPEQKTHLSRSEIRALAESGIFEFGSHSVAHQPLTALSGDELAANLRDSRRMIEDATGRPCTVFAYPFGDFDPAVERAVQEAGYAGAFSSLQGTLHASHARYRLARLTAPPRADGRFLAPLTARSHAWRRGRLAARPRLRS
jgi:peptidoglycan/xylan/chitin deacetylase (PgdA/CDA1 family)